MYFKALECNRFLRPPPLNFFGLLTILQCFELLHDELINYAITHVVILHTWQIGERDSLDVLLK